MLRPIDFFQKCGHIPGVPQSIKKAVTPGQRMPEGAEGSDDHAQSVELGEMGRQAIEMPVFALVRDDVLRPWIACFLGKKPGRISPHDDVDMNGIEACIKIGFRASRPRGEHTDRKPGDSVS